MGLFDGRRASRGWRRASGREARPPSTKAWSTPWARWAGWHASTARPASSLWEKDLLQEYGIAPDDEAAAVPWGRAASPLVVGDRLIVPIGGRKGGRLVSLAAFDKRSGALLWEGGDRQISYSSPALATLAGIEQILIVNEATVSGHDVTTGRPLWEHPWPGHTNRDPNVSQAVPIAPNLVFVSKGYGQGAMLLRLDPGRRRRSSPRRWSGRIRG